MFSNLALTLGYLNPALNNSAQDLISEKQPTFRVANTGFPSKCMKSNERAQKFHTDDSSLQFPDLAWVVLLIG